MQLDFLSLTFVSLLEKVTMRVSGFFNFLSFSENEEDDELVDVVSDSPELSAEVRALLEKSSVTGSVESKFIKASEEKYPSFDIEEMVLGLTKSRTQRIIESAYDEHDEANNYESFLRLEENWQKLKKSKSFEVRF